MPASSLRVFAAILALASGLTLGSCAPDTMLEQGDLPTRTAAQSRLLVVLHGGAGDTPADWADAFIEDLSPRLPEPNTWAAHAPDWGVDSEDSVSAARKGLRLGEEYAELLLEGDPQPEHVLIVAHSVGSFFAHGIVRRLDEDTSRPRVHVIFLDPFTLRTIAQWNYGNNRFGEGADVAESYFNSDDPVPSTNGALEQAHNVDVTGLRADDLPEDDWHRWPIDAWLSLDREDAGVRLVKRALTEDVHASLPRGDTLSLD